MLIYVSISVDDINWIRSYLTKRNIHLYMTTRINTKTVIIIVMIEIIIIISTTTVLELNNLREGHY